MLPTQGLNSTERVLRSGCWTTPDFFFFQAEDGIRDTSVTGVQTCALPISGNERNAQGMSGVSALMTGQDGEPADMLCQPVDSYSAALAVIAIQSALFAREQTGQIGRASCRERV